MQHTAQMLNLWPTFAFMNHNQLCWNSAVMLQFPHSRPHPSPVFALAAMFVVNIKPSD